MELRKSGGFRELKASKANPTCPLSRAVWRKHSRRHQIKERREVNPNLLATGFVKG